LIKRKNQNNKENERMRAEEIKKNLMVEYMDYSDKFTKTENGVVWVNPNKLTFWEWVEEKYINLLLELEEKENEK